MLDRRLSGLEKRLRRDPRDRGAWLELAHLCERGGLFPPFLRADHAPLLVELWGDAPDDRSLGELLLPLLELELVRDRGQVPGEWWRTRGRLGDSGDHWYDLETGLPLNVRHAKTGVELVWIPPGEFFMGGAAYADERPIHRVRLSGFWMGRFPVTVDEYAAFLAGDGGAHPGEGGAPGEEGEGGPAPPEDWELQLDVPERPVVGVDWFDAQAWCRWAGGRLPREAEWEKAARGTDGRLFPWGDASPSPRLANFNPGSRKLRDWDRHLLPVGDVPGDLSPFGVHDLGGNAAEWCQDWYDPRYYERSPVEDPAGPRTGQRVALRGNSWYCEPEWDEFRASVRKSRVPHEEAPWLGFRMVRELLPPGAAGDG